MSWWYKVWHIRIDQTIVPWSPGKPSKQIQKRVQEQPSQRVRVRKEGKDRRKKYWSPKEDARQVAYTKKIPNPYNSICIKRAQGFHSFCVRCSGHTILETFCCTCDTRTEVLIWCLAIVNLAAGRIKNANLSVALGTWAIGSFSKAISGDFGIETSVTCLWREKPYPKSPRALPPDVKHEA